MRTPPFSLIVSDASLIASLSVFASLRLTFVLMPEPVVIAKYTVFGSSPSGICPVSPITRTDSPFINLCASVKVITLAFPPSLKEPILLIPAILLLTSNIFSAL